MIDVAPGRDLSAGTCVSYENPDLWHSDDKAELDAARRLCLACPVLSDCRTVALSPENSDPLTAYGVWAGMGAQARIRATAGRRREARASRHDEIVRLGRDGIGVMEIARRVDMTHSAVSQVLSATARETSAA